MGFFSKFIPKEIKKPFKKIGKESVNFLRSAGDKLVPNEIRKFVPYLAAAAPYTNFMFPGSGFFSGAIGRGLLSSLYNVAGQAVADPEGEDINLLSAALAGVQGYGATPGAGDKIRGMTTAGDPALATKEGIMSQLQNAPLGSQSISEAANTSLLTKAKDLGLTGVAKAADFLGGAKETLGDIGTGEIDLFTKEGAKAAAKASAPILSQGSGDLAYAEANKALREFNEIQAEELAQAGLSLSEINLARRDAITEAMTDALFSDEDINATLDELGLLDFAQGGIASLKNGGILGFNDGGPVVAPRDRVNNYLGYRPEDFNEKLGTFQDGTTISDRQMPMGLGIPPSGNYADNFLNQSPKTLTVDNTDNSNPYSNDKRRENVIQAMMAAKHSQATIDEALGELGLKDGGIASLKDGGMLNFGGREMDLRSGGFVPIGKKERADDVPARLSKNEFVMTADAVRAAGGGSVNKGAQRMYDIMNRLEARA